jgi:hypothetical protein
MSERDREAAETWSRGPERPITWLPPTPDRNPPPIHGARYESTDPALQILLYVFGAICIVNVLGIVSDALEVNLANRIISGDGVTGDQRDGNDLRQAIVGGIQLLMLIVGAMTWISWFHASYRNAGVLGATRRFGEGWAIGSWLVPILNVWRPKQIANDLWAAGERGGDPKQPPVLLLWWWLAWLFGGQAAAGGFGFDSDPTAREMRVYGIVDIGTGLISIAAAILACVVAVQISERLKARAASGDGVVQSP